MYMYRTYREVFAETLLQLLGAQLAAVGGLALQRVARVLAQLVVRVDLTEHKHSLTNIATSICTCIMY